MNRRRFLASSIPVGMAVLTGCQTQLPLLGCNSTDRLDVARAPSSVGELSYVTIIHFSDLSSAEQQAVEKALSQGGYEVCHDVDDPNGIMQLSERIQQRWQRDDSVSSEPADRTFLEYSGNYYGLRLQEEDVTVVTTIPLDCWTNESCHSFTGTPEAPPQKGR